jgi:hypothetical protein
MSRVPTVEDFVAHVGTTVTPEGQHRVLTLVSVNPAAPSGQAGPPRESLSLILRGPPDDVLPEGMYDFAFGDGPDAAEGFALYIAPIHTPARDRQDYQIVFN